jgi:hypothetical protein
MFDPFLGGAHWTSDDSTRNGPYFRVTAAGTKGQLAPSLTSDGAQLCGTCHRIGGAGTCANWAKDAMGESAVAALQDSMKAPVPPADPNSGTWGVWVDASGFKWNRRAWMPDFNYASLGLKFPESPANWAARYGAARENILKCCASPGTNTNDCQWTPTPTE